MLRRPPRSTLFPYTTALPISCVRDDCLIGRLRVGRGSSLDAAAGHDAGVDGLCVLDHSGGVPDRAGAGERRSIVRSEEHTSELQSQFHLVCRLLLEKKKYDNK